MLPPPYSSKWPYYPFFYGFDCVPVQSVCFCRSENNFSLQVIKTEVLGCSVHSLVRIPATICWLVRKIVLRIFAWSGRRLLDAVVTDYKLICKHFASRTEEDDEKAK